MSLVEIFPDIVVKSFSSCQLSEFCIHLSAIAPESCSLLRVDTITCTPPPITPATFQDCVQFFFQSFVHFFSRNPNTSWFMDGSWPQGFIPPPPRFVLQSLITHWVRHFRRSPTFIGLRLLTLSRISRCSKAHANVYNIYICICGIRTPELPSTGDVAITGSTADGQIMRISLADRFEVAWGDLHGSPTTEQGDGTNLLHPLYLVFRVRVVQPV